MIETVLAALAARDWYALAVMAVLLLVAIIKARPAVWDRLPRRLQWLPAVLMGAAAGFVDAARAGEAWHLALAQAVGAGLQIGLGAVGTYHAIVKRLLAPGQQPPDTRSGTGVGERIVVPISTNPPPGGGGAAAMTGMWLATRRLGVALVAIFALTLIPGILGGCSPSSAQWQAQADVASTAADTMNRVVLPVLEDAYRLDGLRAIRSAANAAEVDAALDRVRKRWAPIWASWDGVVAAHDAWARTIEARGDPVATGAAARDAYCRLRASAPAFDVRLPQFPVVPC